MLMRFWLAAAVLFSAPACAQPAGSPSDASRRAPTIATVIDACQADLREVCGDEPFEMSRLSQCVVRNRERVSPACQAVLPETPEPTQGRRNDPDPRQGRSEALRSVAREMRQACARDIRSACGDKTGRERRTCLSENSDRFSEACRTALSDLRRARQAERRGGNRRNADDF